MARARAAEAARARSAAAPGRGGVMGGVMGGGPLRALARAKINLTLRVLGRRADGYHELESLVAFAGLADRLDLDPSGAPGLDLAGGGFDPGAAADNLVLRAAAALGARAELPPGGRFRLDKRLPVAAGLGGGSADAAAALRLLARRAGLAPGDPRLAAAAAAVGADVPVCLASRARVMRGVGHDLGPVVRLPPLPAVLLNPGVPTPTAAVFAALGLARGAPTGAPSHPPVPAAPDRAAVLALLAAVPNDLEPPARAVAPAIGEALAALAGEGALAARLSGSGATCFGLFAGAGEARAAARRLARARPGWWARATVLR